MDTKRRTGNTFPPGTGLFPTREHPNESASPLGLLPWPPRSEPHHNNAPVCAARVGMDRKRRTGPEAVWDAFPAPHKSYLDLSADRQPEGCPTLARKGDILPANNRLKHASLTDFILASARR